MAKKNENIENDVEIIEPDKVKKNEKPVDTKKNNKKQDKPKKEKKSAKKKVGEIFSELKKVSWPSFGTVVKSTCVVIAVVAICTVFLFGIDKLLSYLYDLLITVA